MNDRHIITIDKQDGTIEEVEEVISFQFEDTKREYVVYTKGEKDSEGNVTVYVTRLVKDGNENKFVGIESDEEWARIKDALRELAKQEA